jgi:uncharacterized protein (TIGR00251 family)
MIQSVADGVVLSVRVIPRAATSRVDGVRAGALLVRLQAAPVDGAANDALIGVLAEALGVPKRRVTIVSGARGREKRVHVRGVDVDAVRAAVANV